ncbi:MAG: hypothetical protein ACRDUA_13065 [Micromonosporaceae bacterium]
MTPPPGYPGRPEFGDDPYGGPGYGSDPYRQPGNEPDPYRHAPDPSGPTRSRYGDHHAGYGEPPSRHGYGEPDRDQPRYGEPTPGYREPPPRHGYGRPPDSPPTSYRDAPSRHYDPDATAQIRMPSGFDAPPPYGEPSYGEPPPRAPRGGRPPGRSKVGLLLGIVGGVLALVLIGGAAVVLLGGAPETTGGKKTGSPKVHPDFADPEKVVDSWLNAMFVLKDPDKMLRYTCKREADRGEVNEAIKTVKDAEADAKDAKLKMKVSWSKPKAVSTGETTTKVTSTLKVVVGDETKNTPARFDLVNEAGWKVCDTEMP